MNFSKYLFSSLILILFILISPFSVCFASNIPASSVDSSEIEVTSLNTPDEQPAHAISLPENEPDIKANAAILVNNTENQILYEKNASERIFPASTTKILTVLIIISAIEEGKYSLDDTFKADESIYYDDVNDSSTQNIQPGEEMSVRDYLYCTLLSSANEACNALAVFHSGSIEKFVYEMNMTAQNLGCSDTHFVNTNGLPNDEHYTTAYDLYLIFRKALTFDIFREISSSFTYTVKTTNLSPKRELYNTNRLIDSNSEYYYRFAVLGKTGTTNTAGNCLVSLAKKGENELISVIMGAKTSKSSGHVYVESFSETKKLFEYGFTEFVSTPFVVKGKVYGNTTVRYGSGTSFVPLVSKDTISFYMSKGAAVSTECTLTMDDGLNLGLEAPISSGLVVGKITAFYGDEIIGETDLIVENSVRRSHLKYFSAILGISQSQVILLCAAILLILLIIIGIIIIVIAQRRTKAALSAAMEEEAVNLSKYEAANKDKDTANK